ncbi:MAG: FAD-dependent oxidoreductase [Candidatus Sungbacteria bacterium]|uniref:FAD-dependent oxidoreductase n=1 Tax=Candidatus Sungiibacteriota bacterium TaxID=2750080 RepID=A0A9D6HQT1_9BACT|nr:FAD-dependent oxidoreductase [Candidatus Sungbacteria bacterium]
MFDLIIVGASAAGLSASVYAARRRMNFKIISADIGGEVATSGEIENWPGVIHTDGVALADQFKAHALANKVIIDEGKWVGDIKKEGNIFLISGKNPDGSAFEVTSKSVLVATGVHPRELGVPGEKEFRNKGVSYCTVCDGPLFSGQTVATIGGGNSALESALMLADIAAKVYLINKNSYFKGEKVLIDKVSQNPKIEIIYQAMTSAVKGDKFVNAVEYKNESGETHKLEVKGIFVHIGQIPNSGFMAGAELDETKQIKVNLRGETNLPGLYAAGDVTNIPYKQIVIAAGQGVTALLSAVDYLNRNH